MIRRVTIRNFKRFREQTFLLEDSVVLAGPNNAGKSTLLQAISTWKFARDRWVAQRTESKTVKRSGVATARNQFTPVPLREMNLLWEDRRVTGPKGIAGGPRQIEIAVAGRTNGNGWECGFELQYVNQEMVYVRPLNAGASDRQAIRNFPPKDARDFDIIRVPSLSGFEIDEPRRDRGMQDLLVGLGRPGDILRNLLLEIAEAEDPRGWKALTGYIRALFGIEIQPPVYAPADAYILCEYRDPANTRPLDLASAGSGTLQVLLLLAFLYARPATVILLDEPDAHQHVILQRQVYELIRKVAGERGGQVVVATHSEAILDLTPPERVLDFSGEMPRALVGKAESAGRTQAAHHNPAVVGR